MEKHPEIRNLYGYDVKSAFFCACTVVAQLVGCVLVRNVSMPWLLLATYSISGTLNASLVLAMHELAHDLFLPTVAMNRWFSYFANLPTGVPSAATFR